MFWGKIAGEMGVRNCRKDGSKDGGNKGRTDGQTDELTNGRTEKEVMVVVAAVVIWGTWGGVGQTRDEFEPDVYFPVEGIARNEEIAVVAHLHL